MIVDIIIILIILASVFVGIKKGLISCIVDIFAVIVALILALILCRPITNIVIENTNFDENLREVIIQNIPLNDANFKVDENTNLPKPVIDYINGITDGVTASKDDAVDAIGRELTVGIITAIVFISIFIIVRIVLVLIKVVSKIIDKIPGLKEANKIGGGICGAIEGIIIVYAILAVFSMISPILADTNILQYIYNSHIGALMYNHNIILKSIYKI